MLHARLTNEPKLLGLCAQGIFLGVFSLRENAFSPGQLTGRKLAELRTNSGNIKSKSQGYFHPGLQF
jgi:hypothetical protein